ncbi:MAG: DNA polymerase/3'-5' exonuclease PolX [Saprospirales bacterium]|nr:DNA polymerase/3'-5' exonuclease PolX [Saprospirales bacterium]MBK8493360.1 DNA polymerase/3'-5' exonuclease PolX [Saprospirales bacterium]
MTTNKEIAKSFQLLGELMELHGENPFKIRSYQNAYLNLRKMDQPLSELSEAELSALKGVGNAISGKIRELVETGKMQTLERYKAQTPEGLQEILQVPGLGPKKIRLLWKELDIESIGELLYAVNENRLLDLKGFGLKTQEDLRQKLEFFQHTRHLYHYAAAWTEAGKLLETLRNQLPGRQIELTGAIRRKNNVVDRIEFLVEGEEADASFLETSFPVHIHFAPANNFGTAWVKTTDGSDFWDQLAASNPDQPTEQALFAAAGLPFVEPELRDIPHAIDWARKGAMPQLVEATDLKGLVHAHSTYSDGMHSLREMAIHARSLGYQYLGITDHSQSAFYANGLKPDRVRAQWEEIDALNAELAPFRIFKGIESDILNDGRLDYESDILDGFDFIIASIHSNLRMDEEKATQRLITAIEDPHTRILGHPTGRLLLSRTGYPIDHKKVIDACAANGVAIELNANPYRLDLDWTWIPYAREKDVLIAINPDAHSKSGMLDMHFGLCAARKGGLTAEGCLNALSAEAFNRFFSE